MEIDRSLYVTTTLDRYTNGSVEVPRFFGKIALEEAVGTKLWDAYGTLPATEQVSGYAGVPFSSSVAADIESRLTDIPARLQSMNDSGIGYVIVSLTSPGIEGVFNATNATKLATEVNDEMYTDYVQAYPDRFGFFATVPMQDPVAAAAELERAVTELGAKGALINGYSQIGTSDNYTVQYLDDDACDPFWAKVAELNVPVWLMCCYNLHPRPPPPSQQLLMSGYPMMAHAAYGFGTETAGHALRLMLSGLFDRYPNIQIILGHCAEALPFLIHRIDTRLAIGIEGADGPYNKTMKYYLRNNFYATLAGVRRLSTVRDTIDEMGEDRVMWSVDYPYESNEDAANWFDYVEGLGVRTKQKLAWENAERVFNITAGLDPYQEYQEFL
ncbi:putative Amidohydrolase-related domain-containing protein [Seiridium unicorne]|uniref:Amidohydrolase-related domain-containing protein n=1 Tax=Seiridium unicorne TaxID=138068 RepID=A0ABR2UXB8_9PEZI